jgi:hypothetical protein
MHHKNGIRSDNGPANLELRARGLQPPGSRVSDLIDAAVMVLKLYQPEPLNTHALHSWGRTQELLSDSIDTSHEIAQFIFSWRAITTLKI